VEDLEKLTKTQVSVLAAYSMPFVLIIAIVINSILHAYGLAGSLIRLIFLSLSFPLGFSIGRIVYLKRSHVEIMFDDLAFQLIKGSREVSSGYWSNFKHVSIALDKYGRPDLRLYKSVDGEHVDLPISSTNADPQGFRDYVQNRISKKSTPRINPQVVEAA
jgi:hypothetical protein